MEPDLGSLQRELHHGSGAAGLLICASSPNSSLFLLSSSPSSSHVFFPLEEHGWEPAQLLCVCFWGIQ